MTTLTVLLSFLIAVQCLQDAYTTAFPFVDESKKRGLRYLSRPRLKYGGACVVDLDEDGWPDLVFGHHGGAIEVYFNKGNGFFKKAPFQLFRDCHGINSFRLSTYDFGKHFIISRGGANGNKPGIPDIFHVSADKTIRNVTEQMNGPLFAGRGRTFLALNLKSAVLTRIDGIFINAVPKNDTISHYFARGIVSSQAPTFKFQKISGTPFDSIRTEYSAVTDIDNDGKMEIIAYPNLKMYKQIDFHLTDISSKVFAGFKGSLSRIITVAEIDYDNDGDMDLFIGRANVGGGVGYGKPFASNGPPDTLFENVGGIYVDVTAKAKIPNPAQTRGATTGDFNNDGFVDLMLTRYFEPDVILFNNGDGTFSQHEAGFNRSASTLGDMVTAVDFDKDGRLDVVVSEGAWGDRERGGEYRLMRNVGDSGNYLAVRVGSAPFKKCTSLHAVVRVYVDGMIMTRRIGSPGSVVSHSYIENVHFGLGDRLKVDSVNVTWVDGSTESKANVAANHQLEFGVNRL